MKIENIRMGLATNSSSSHSIIFNLDARSRDWQDGEFGWNEFCCNCEDSKRMYLAAMLYQNMQGSVGDDIARAVVESWVETELKSLEDDYFYGIDHQSLMTLPINAQTGQPDKEFFQELLAYYLNPKLAIVGGNDNESSTIFKEGRENHRINTDGYRGTHVCRKDPKTGHWVLFNRYNGTKIRMHFDKDAPDYTKAFAPELVDVKITDFCPEGSSCRRYCYQDSTKEGTHGELDFIESLAYSFKDMGVFEVALGGGEPTMHPDFVKILKAFRRHGIVPNFTTRSNKWLKDQEVREAVKKNAGKFAFSVSQVENMERAWHLADEFKMSNSEYDYGERRHRCRMGFQYVMGSTNLDEFRDLIRAIPFGCEMTLLGYKDIGRGSTYKPYDYGGWLQVVEDVGKCKNIGIDTSLANQHKDAILEAGNERLVTFEEVKFSMYIDAVTQRAAPSSYCDEDEYIDVGNKHGCDWQKMFERF